MTVRLIALLAVSFSALAADSGPDLEQVADWQQRLAQAEALKAESAARQLAAEQALETQSLACYKKFFVNACLHEARQAHLMVGKETRRMEIEGKALERAVKKEQLADKDQRRSAAEPQHEADLKAREAEVSTERKAALDKEAATLADKAKKAEEGSKRQAADAEKYRKKQADHDARVAAKVQEAERRAAEAAAAPK